MTYQVKEYSQLKGLEGFSDQLLENHFALYQGYVNNTNKLMEKLENLGNEDKTVEPEFAEMKRRLGWEWNGMRLHEYLFENMKKGGSKLAEGSALYQKIVQQFNSVEAWEKSFKAVAAMRGIGWAAMYYDTKGDRIINFWINEHNANHMAGEPLLLIMDVFEHAFMLDYGTKKPDYIESFMKIIDWETVAKRFEAAK